MGIIVKRKQSTIIFFSFQMIYKNQLLLSPASPSYNLFWEIRPGKKGRQGAGCMLAALVERLRYLS